MSFYAPILFTYSFNWPSNNTPLTIITQIMGFDTMVVNVIIFYFSSKVVFLYLLRGGEFCICMYNKQWFLSIDSNNYIFVTTTVILVIPDQHKLCFVVQWKTSYSYGKTSFSALGRRCLVLIVLFLRRFHLLTSLRSPGGAAQRLRTPARRVATRSVGASPAPLEPRKQPLLHYAGAVSPASRKCPG